MSHRSHLSEVISRYSATADAYSRYWAGVLPPAGRHLVEGLPLSEARRILDLGSGVGTLLPVLAEAAPRADVFERKLDIHYLTSYGSLTTSGKEKVMSIPRWMANVNRKVFNPRAAKSGKWPVLIHVGRTSGKVRETPLDAHQVDGGYIFIANYGAESDWVQNIIASGKATLRIEGEEVLLEAPRLVSEDEAVGAFTGKSKPLPGFLNVHDYLRMDTVA